MRDEHTEVRLEQADINKNWTAKYQETDAEVTQLMKDAMNQHNLYEAQ
jgi:uncharacterized membrane protein